MTFLKYPGGKQRELVVIRKYLPEKIENYFEPFVGGGAVYFDTLAEHYYINDKSTDLIHLYNAVKTQDEVFFETLHNLDKFWKFLTKFTEKHKDVLKNAYIKYRDSIITDEEIECLYIGFIEKHKQSLLKELGNYIDSDVNDLFDEIKKYFVRKIKSLKKLEFNKEHLPEDDIIPNIEGALKAGFYMYIRHEYNKYLTSDKNFEDGVIAAFYLFIRETTYSSMFRFNDKGEFNVPYGGISYNNKNFQSKIDDYHSKDLIARLNNTTIGNEDFHEFMNKYSLSKNDFLFIDPPYDSEFSSYDKSAFEHSDQKRLADYLINHCEAKFMVVIKNTDFIASLYPEGTLCKNGNKLEVLKFDKKYAVSFMNRNDKKCEHLLIKNY